VAEPLLEFCRSPRLAPDHGQVPALSSGTRLALAGKAWYSLREEGPRRFLARGYGFVRKRLT